MSETSVTPAELVASALAAHPWNSYPKAAHRDHGFDSGCAVCKGDVEALANVAVYALADADALAGARLVVIPAEDLRQAVDAVEAVNDPYRYLAAEPELLARLRAALPERTPDA